MTDLVPPNFEEWYDSYYDAFARMDMLDDGVDYGKLADAGTKLIISSCTEDEHIPVDGLIKYYNDIQRETFGDNPAKAREHMRLFLSPGGDHVAPLFNEGYSPCMADAMIALMKWVEEGVAPESIMGQHVDMATGEVEREEPVFMY